MTNSKKNQNKNTLYGAISFTGKCLNIVLSSLPFYLVWHWFYSPENSLIMTGLYAFLYVIFANLYGVFSVSLSRVPELIYSQALAVVIADIILFFVTLLQVGRYISVWPMILILCAQIAVSVLWSFLSDKVYSSICPPLRTVLIKDETDDTDFSAELKKAAQRFKLTETITISEYLRNPEQYLETAETIFLTDTHSHKREQVIKDCVQKNIPLYFIPTVADALISNADLTPLFYHPFVKADTYSPSLFYLFIKRCMDIFISLFALVILSPLMIATALLIRRDGGSVFYRQKRLTKNRKVFEVLKFRSMTVNAESDGVARLSTGEHDSRVTPVGRIIRRFRIDELPQLFNVLRGEMSIVGPRPERPELATEYEKTLPEFALRLQAKAGLTGYAQVYGKYNTKPYEKLLMDLQYMSRPGLLNDLKIIFATVKVLFIPESTEGVNLSQSTDKASDREGVNAKS